MPEIEDQPWCPSLIRNGATDFLKHLIHLLNPYGTVVPLLRDALQKTGTRKIVDLCSGAGGPWIRLFPLLKKQLKGDLHLYLTDLYPNANSFSALMRKHPDQVKLWAKQVDARHPPEGLKGFFTLFTSAHHFSPIELQAILAHAVERRQGIAIFEMSHRSLRGILLVFLVPFAVWVTTPLNRPLSISRLFWTYLVPLMPLVSFCDGLASCLRSYRPAELQEIVAGLKENEYEWVLGEKYSRYPIPVTYLIGIPSNSSSKGA